MTTQTDEKKNAFDMERAIELTKLGASDREILCILGAAPDDLTAARKRELERYRSERLVRLKAKLYELALKGNAQAVMRLMREETGTKEEGRRKK